MVALLFVLPTDNLKQQQFKLLNVTSVIVADVIFTFHCLV